MKFKINDELVFELTEIQKKIIQNDIPTEIFEDEMKRRVQYWYLEEKVRKGSERLRKEWEPKLLERGIEMFPASNEAFAALVFEQPDYKNRSDREKNLS